MHFLAKCIVFLSICVSAYVAAADSPLTESQAVELGLSRVDVRDWLEGQLAAAEAESHIGGHWDNPEFEYSRESVDLPGGENRETSYFLRQRFNIAGQLGIRHDAASQQRRANEEAIELAKRELTADIRRTFYEVLHATRHADAMQRGVERLTKLNDALVQRTLAGGISRYDSLRLKREAALLRGQAATARTQAEVLQEKLKGLIGVTNNPTGNLLPPAVPTVAELEQQVLQHPEMRRLGLEADSQRLTAKAASREAWPDVTVGVGQRELTSPGLSGDGNTLELGIEIPLFHRGNAESDRASARARSLHAEQNLMRQQLLAGLHGTVNMVQARRKAAEDLSAVNGAGSLIAAAEQSYWSGEMQVMNLIDAHRTELNAQGEELALQLNARMAYIELQTLIGEDDGKK
jgi:cobalt-zinc-cadmium efflux system outer membrane protein